MPLHSDKPIGLMGAMKDMMSKSPMKIMIKKHCDSDHEEDQCSSSQEELISHHLDDIKEALQKCIQALASGDLKEVVDNAVLIQSSSKDVEELVTKKDVKI